MAKCDEEVGWWAQTNFPAGESVPLHMPDPAAMTLTFAWISSFGLIWRNMVSSLVRITSSWKAVRLNSPVDASRVQIPKEEVPVASSVNSWNKVSDVSSGCGSYLP